MAHLLTVSDQTRLTERQVDGDGALVDGERPDAQVMHFLHAIDAHQRSLDVIKVHTRGQACVKATSRHS